VVYDRKGVGVDKKKRIVGMDDSLPPVYDIICIVCHRK